MNVGKTMNPPIALWNGDAARFSKFGRVHDHRGGDYPASWAQRRIWSATHAMATPTCHLLLKARWHADPQLLSLIVAEALGQTESFCSLFSASGEAVRVLPPGQTTVEVVDCRPLNRDEFAQAVDRFISSTFSLVDGPVVRARVYGRSPDEYFVALACHAIAADVNSLRIFARRLAIRLEADSGTGTRIVPQLPYSEYAAREVHWLASNEVEEDRSYWASQIENTAVRYELPFARPSSSASVAALQRSTRWCDELMGQLIEYAEAEGVEPVRVLLVAWQALLARYAGEERVGVISSVPVRALDEGGSLVGPASNIVILTIDLSAEPSTSELMAQAGRMLDEADRHKETPLEAWAQNMAPPFVPPIPGRWPASFLVEEFDSRLDSSCQEVGAGGGFAPAPLGLRAGCRADEVELHLDFFPEIIPPQWTVRLARQYVQLLRNMIETPQCPVTRISVLEEAERRRILVDFNRTEVARKPTCFHETLSQQAAKTPKALAISQGCLSATFSEVDSRSNALAHLLRAKGLERGHRVGVVGSQPIDLALAIFAILKAGGTVVPIDPQYPSEYAALIAQKAGLRTVVASADQEERWSRILPTERIDTTMPGVAPPLGLSVSPEDSAFVCFTSGTTGEPKGVVISHAAATASKLPGSATICLEASDRLLHTAPFGTTGFSAQLAWPWSFGASAHFPVPEHRTNVPALLGILLELEITAVNVTPSMLLLLLELPRIEECTSLRHIICYGEPLPAEVVNRCKEVLPASIYNGYGQTEIAPVAYWRCRDFEPGPYVPVGRPVANTQIYVVDRNLQPVPFGARGEILAGGVNLATGYLDDDALTKSKFVENPFGSGRLYRTGDMGRLHEDGILELLGRKDQLAKVRGNRVEPLHVESVLRSHPSVRRAAVAVYDEGPAGAGLVAYLVCDPELAEPRLRTLLRRVLPGFMIPGRFVRVDELPLTANGKVAYTRLLPSLGEPLRSEPAEETPHLPLERQLAEIWQDVLGVDTVRANDDFLDLGGHSLLAVYVAFATAERLGIVVPADALFENPTLAGFTRYLAALKCVSQGREDGEGDSEFERLIL